MTFSYGTASIVSLLLCIILFVIAFQLVKKDQVDGVDTQEKCNMVLNPLSGVALKDGQLCGVWSKNICRKGSFNMKDRNCVAKPDWIPFLLLSASGISLIGALVFAWCWRKHKTA